MCSDAKELTRTVCLQALFEEQKIDLIGGTLDNGKKLMIEKNKTIVSPRETRVFIVSFGAPYGQELN